MHRHEVDAVSLTFGLIFLGIVNAWVMWETGAADVEGLRWFFPVLLLAAGAAGVISSLLRGRRARQEDASVEADASEEGVPFVDTPEGSP